MPPTSSPEVNWMVERGLWRRLSDGTITVFFEGRLPSRMVQRLIDWQKANNGFGEPVIEGDISISVRFGKHLSSANTVRMTLNDYRVPAAAEAQQS